MTTAIAPKAQGAIVIRHKCPNCGRVQIYYRRKTNDYACKACPWKGLLKQQDKPEVKEKKK